MMRLILFALNWLALANGRELYFVDAHSQIDHQVDQSKVIDLMDQSGVYHTILSARGELMGSELIAFSQANRTRITAAVRTKGGPYSKGSREYYTNLNKQMASGKYRAMAEVLLYHAQKGNKAPEVIVLPDDPRVRAALKHALQQGWPFVAHIEFASLSRVGRERFMKAFETMLSENPQHPFILTHVGQLKADEARQLIESHKNIHFHTGWTNPAAVKSSRQPWTNLFSGNALAPEWRQLMVQYPERFLFALDNVFAEHWANFYLVQMEYWRKALSDLPAKAAHSIAHGNAERLWKLAPRSGVSPH